MKKEGIKEGGMGRWLRGLVGVENPPIHVFFARAFGITTYPLVYYVLLALGKKRPPTFLRTHPWSSSRTFLLAKYRRKGKGPAQPGPDRPHDSPLTPHTHTHTHTR